MEQQAAQEFLKLIPAGGRILDAGFGKGVHLRRFASNGFITEGFDPSEENVEEARRIPGVKVWKSDFLFLSLARGTYDGIWCHQALDPLPPPGVQRAIASFFAALKPKGHLFVSVDESRDGFPPDEEFASLLRQNGFQILARGQPADAPTIVGYIARRI